MRNIKLLVALLFMRTILLGQTSEASGNNAVSLELGKTGLIYNLSIDRKVKDNIGVRVTAGTNFSNYLKAFSAFGGGYYLAGKNKALELGIDIGYLSVRQLGGDQRNLAFIFPDYSIKTYYLNLNIGYRKCGDKTLFRAGFAPGYCKAGPLPGAYISFGVRF